jgi:hypothetical protein
LEIEIKKLKETVSVNEMEEFEAVMQGLKYL